MFSIDDICCDNSQVLKLTTLLFFVFTLAELVGGYVSNSLSLLDDAYAMLLDVITYLLNLYAEEVKVSNREVSIFEAFAINSLIPIASIIVLLVLCTKIMLESITTVRNPPAVNDVDVSYMYIFSLTNFVIDVIVVGAFIYRGKDIFYEKVMDFKHLRINHHKKSNDTREKYLTGSKYQAVEMQNNCRRVDSDDDNDNDNGDNMNRLEENVPLLSHKNGHRNTNSKSNGNSNSSSSNNSSGNSSSSSGNKSMNMVMMTAFSHVGGDSLRTLAVFAASVISTTTGADPDICDAWSALVSCIGIILGCLYLLMEVGKKAVIELNILMANNSDGNRKSTMDGDSSEVDGEIMSWEHLEKR